jgi:hypothetical protein
MQKLELYPRRVLARTLAIEELIAISGNGPDTTWTDGDRKDFTQISAGDVPGTPPPI